MPTFSVAVAPDHSSTQQQLAAVSTVRRPASTAPTRQSRHRRGPARWSPATSAISPTRGRSGVQSSCALFAKLVMELGGGRPQMVPAQHVESSRAQSLGESYRRDARCDNAQGVRKRAKHHRFQVSHRGGGARDGINRAAGVRSNRVHRFDADVRTRIPGGNDARRLTVDPVSSLRHKRGRMKGMMGFLCAARRAITSEYCRRHCGREARRDAHRAPGSR